MLRKCGEWCQSKPCQVSCQIQHCAAGCDFCAKPTKGWIYPRLQTHDSGGRPAANGSGTLYVLVGDSIDRTTVEAKCPDPRTYDALCDKCRLCRDGADTWLNVMTFGVGMQGCYHASSYHEGSNTTHDMAERVRGFLGRVMRMYHTRHTRTVLQLNSGLWDILASVQCGYEFMQPFKSGEWRDATRRSLVEAAMNAVRGYEGVYTVWRSMPFTCMNLESSRVSSTPNYMALASNEGVRVACEAGFRLVDTRSVACSTLKASDLMPDGVHWSQWPHYGKFASELKHVERHKDACNAPRADPACERERCRDSRPGYFQDKTPRIPGRKPVCAPW